MSIYPTRYQVNTVTNIEVIWKNVFSYARSMVIGVSGDLKTADCMVYYMKRCIYTLLDLCRAYAVQ